MRAIIILVSVACCCALLTVGCGGAGRASGKRTVVASFYPLAYAAQELGGSGVDVRNLTPAGAEPHDLEVKPSDVREVRAADLVLLLGHGFQPQLEDAAGSGRKILRLLDTPGLNRFPNNDPHVWLDPLRYALIVQRIGAALNAKPAAQRFVARLNRLDREYRKGLVGCKRHEIVTSHEAFAYLGQRYGLRQVAITGLSPEAEPSPKDLQQVVELVRRTHATTIFFETLVSPRIAQTVARETGAKTAVLNPIEGLTKDGSRTGRELLHRDALEPRCTAQALGCR